MGVNNTCCVIALGKEVRLGEKSVGFHTGYHAGRVTMDRGQSNKNLSNETRQKWGPVLWRRTRQQLGTLNSLWS